MPKRIFDDGLWFALEHLEDVKSQMKDLKKQEDELRKKIDPKLEEYGDEEVLVGNMGHMKEDEENDDPIYAVKYTETERRNIDREMLLEGGVTIDQVLYATKVSNSKRFNFKRA